MTAGALVRHRACIVSLWLVSCYWCSVIATPVTKASYRYQSLRFGILMKTTDQNAVTWTSSNPPWHLTHDTWHLTPDT